MVWQKSMDLVLKIYKLTENFPKSELYGLTSQIKRCAVSIPSNIAEGKLRKSKKEFIQFLRISYGSGAELETQIEISKRLQFTDIKNYEKVDVLLLEIMKILNTLLKNLKDPK
ncbi:MAG: four helix bundle protein [Patescibacteria group bacterium]